MNLLGSEEGEGKWGKSGEGTQTEQVMYYLLLQLYHLWPFPLLWQLIRPVPFLPKLQSCTGSFSFTVIQA